MSKELGNTENPIENVQSHDWNKERLEQLKNLMPDLFTNDGQLNINELKKVVDPSLVTETERYEFRWFGKSNAKREAFTPTDATLVYDENRSVNPTESENIIIEGENLAVLKLLSNSYREQVKCIYIDPPYNTGKDFVYSDKFNQDKKEYWEDTEVTENGFKIDTNTETDGRFHSNWLNMMYSRLLIARQLLQENGIIAIHIDEHEEHHLRKLCEEVFGEENFLGIVVWDKLNPKGDARAISYQHESIVLFAKNSEFLLSNTELRREKPNAQAILRKAEILFKKINKTDLETVNEEFKEWIKCQEGFSGGEKAYSKIDENGKVYRGVSMAWPNKKKAPDEYLIPLIHPITKKECPIPERGWRNPPNTMKELLEKDLILFGEDERKQPERKYLLEENIFENIPSILEFAGSDDAFFKKLELEFDNPKPFKFCKDFLKPLISTEDIVLDFFAGSGTAGHAITELNQEDGGNRKYILVQLPEATDETSEAYKAGYKKISDITIERNKRVVEKIIKEKKTAQPDLFDAEVNAQEQLKGLGFKVFKLQKSNFPRVEYAPDPNKTHEENIEALKKYIRDKEAQLISAFNKEELITEILLKNGFKLNYTLTKQEQFTKNEILFATDGDKEALVCLDGDLVEETIEYFKKNTEQKLIVLERALDTTKKWNLKHYMKDNFKAF
ncbi:MAG: site-specific DNA-methyltransferase [Bacteroidetes bacterium HGW-Bacteroidetes-2]|jgi:adenine-specific DNA-methyltransferase|nr:MAG: site-specific DNA-methyltransferase [Bacteroidetes bacterium HGW-Bacteroidetes-8]PKP26733.1 MAG: site-specific DNA-methyltransferase [Bacteroidetes bacterium HGW-Bacteroidetes-2]